MKRFSTLYYVAALAMLLLPLSIFAQTYSVRVDYDHTQGTVIGEASNISYGQSVTLLAVPNTGYRLLYWETGDTTDVRTITVTRDTTLHVFFEANVYQLTVLSSNEAQGTVTGAGSYRYGQQIAISAVPASGFAFTQWSDGNTDNPRWVTIGTNGNLYMAVFGVANHSINAVPSSPLMGYVQGGGSYPYNSDVTLTAVANQGYQFTGWADGNTNNPRIVHVTGDAYYVANFGIQQHTIGVISDDTVKGRAYGAGNYSHNANAAIYATANHGYHFGRWHDGNTQNPRTIQVTSDVTYMALFDTNDYYVTATTTNSTFGTVAGSGSYKYGRQATVTAVPNQGFRFTSWLDGSTVNPRTFTVLSDTIFIATFSSIPCNLVAIPDDTTHGSVRGSGTYNSGTTVSLVATPVQHYRFSSWSDGDTNNPRQYTITGDVTLVANFVIETYTVRVVTVDSVKGYTIGGGRYAYGSTITFGAYPNRGYSFNRWSDTDRNAIRTVTVTGNTTYTAYFTTNTYRVTAQSADTLMGRVSGSGNYLYGSTVNIIAMPAQHHHFLRWSDNSTVNPRTFTISSDTTFTAIFGYDQFDITVIASDTNLGNVTGTGTYDYGDTITITARPMGYGRRFVSWNDGNTEATRRVVVLSDRTYMALFVESDYSVIVRSADTSMGSVAGGGEHLSFGAHTIIVATPRAGYEFVQWDDGNTDNPRSITITGNYNGEYELVFIASFDVKHLTVAVEYDTTLGTVTGTGVYNYGDTVTLRGVGKEGYRFKRWKLGGNNITENPYTWVITSDFRVTAEFVEGVEGIEEADEAEAIVFGTEGHVVVETATLQPVAIYDAVGRLVVRDANAKQGRREYLVPNTGVYVVRVGESQARKVVVKR